MSGHSKWSTIKRQKGAADARRSQLFTRLAREIAVAAREGGSEPDTNFRLRLVVQRARDNNMPSTNIERAIQRGMGEGAASDLAEVTYEGYGPGGVAILLQAVTDNRNRTVADIRRVLSRSGGSLGEAGSVAWLFEPRGIIVVEAQEEDAEELALWAIDAGAEDVNVEDSTLEIYVPTQDMEEVRRKLMERGVTIASAELSMHPTSLVPLDNKTAEQNLKLLERLEELDDVQQVHCNADFPKEMLVELQP